MRNTYVPYPVRIKDVIVETEDKQLRSFWFEFINPEDAEAFNYTPGQFAELSISGYGEIPIGIASSPTEGKDVLFTVNKVGVVSSQLHNMKPGDVMGIRGPLGNSYPLKQMEGKNVVIVAGGFAVTTLRSTMNWLLHPDNRDRYGKITFIYGARTPGMLLYENEWRNWMQRGDCDIHVTIDRDCEGWDCLVGFVPSVTEQVAPPAENSVALICGPPIMIKFTQPVFDKLGWQPDQIVLSLENRMKCGIGICGRCNVGPYYVCKDGPVFTKEQLDKLPSEY
ncbi:Dihydroorotate dehydrogenase, electron transfer subunit, iron-sulfur cluster binding domain protein [Desulfarculus baarsii DSM 2075]|uniref:Dihydroorotate dehydrogenase, electron transfer subunit, iron-sulfur cluster binding domain protein n=1 Tax=Desulfarculus baarsii (strain ATCC 33931 / DSM 2075 / LMG 7858 / VKM B-1802 / 2st14) TaxID=644282 RepID=E1QII4_DESB2|nr:FAD/NAD(P)-binding protein [Desulfarculus baarsii]ADK85501.1 Dihydroorotate dehydrogenase, electron transfer subunit, iron-sulfur cluster binding domain protein [Desulfarculus baarsii DSM 2075]